MSAWVTSKAHVDAMVSVAIAFPGTFADEPHMKFYFRRGSKDFTQWEEIVCSPENANRIGQALTDDMVTGVSHRYPDDSISELPGARPAWWVEPYVFEPCRAFEDGEVVALVRCYSYQASEHERWEDTFAFDFVHAVEQKLLSRLRERHEAEHGECPHGFEEEDVRTNSLAAAREAVRRILDGDA